MTDGPATELPSPMNDPADPVSSYHSRSLLCRVAWLALGLSLPLTFAPAPSTFAAEWRLAAGEHPWGSFLAGSWKLTQVISSEFDADGRLVKRSTTRTETVLNEVTDEDCTLAIRTRMEVVQGARRNSNQKFASEPAEITLPFRTTAIDATEHEREVLTIDGRRYQTTVIEIKRELEDRRETRRIWHIPGQIPSVLKEIVEVRSKSEPSKLLVSWESKVTSLSFTVRVLDDRCQGWQVKTVRKTPQLTTTTAEYHCREIPGTLVQASTTAVDSEGHVLKQSSTQLQAYGACYAKPVRRRRSRRRNRRRRETPEEARKEKANKDEVKRG